MAEGTPRSLLSAIWGQRKGFIFLPYKDQDGWQETPGIPNDGREIPSVEDIEADRYFCPVVFSKPRRRKEFALPTNLLWADLDPADPNHCILKPSIAWESSPGRYQALWFLKEEIPAEEAARLSKRIAYAEGGDKGGWDVTQVLRLPGTHNFKYPTRPVVKLLWAKRAAYSTAEIKAAYPPVNGEATHAGGTTPTVSWSDIDESVIQSAIAALPIGLRKRITRDPAGADRSKELQILARDLLKAGVSAEVLPHILRRSTFNKFAGRPTEHRDLLQQVESARSAVSEQKLKSKKASPPKAKPPEDKQPPRMDVYQWGDFLQIPTRLRWLIDEAWVDQSVGFISGRSKSYKTWIALDLALSLVSAQPFLGRYPVRRSGPVLLIQEEDPGAVLQERLRLVGKSKGMMPKLRIARSDLVRVEYPEYPLHIINLQGFNLGAEEKIEQVQELIREIRPVAVILDPLIVMLAGTGADENRATEMSLILQAVKQWREQFGCSVIIVHHWNKSKNEDGERFAQHMYGSFVFHAWLESAWHILPVTEDEQEHIDTVLVEREFKAAPSGRNLRLKFNIDSVEKYEYSVSFEDDKTLSPMGQQILDIITEAGAEGVTTPELVHMTGHARPKIVEQLQRMVRHGIVKVIEKGGGRGKSARYGIQET